MIAMRKGERKRELYSRIACDDARWSTMTTDSFNLTDHHQRLYDHASKYLARFYQVFSVSMSAELPYPLDEV